MACETSRDGGVSTAVDPFQVTILVSDVNDNSPIFSRERYMLELSESLPIGTPVTSIVATDEDFGTNGLVNYAIASQHLNANDVIFDSKYNNT